MAVSGIPLFVDLQSPQTWNYIGWLVIHEFSGFLFVGHTFFSNIWAMLIRLKLGHEAGVWARGFLRKRPVGYPSATDLLARRMKERGLCMRIPVMVLTAEPVLPAQRRRSHAVGTPGSCASEPPRRSVNAGKAVPCCPVT